MSVLLQRKVANIYIPPVDVMEDREAMNQLLAFHVEQKNFFAALVEDDICHEDVLEYVETYIGTRDMDNYIEVTEQQLDQLIRCGC
ncbi:MAG: hypothetical protein ACFCAD_16900 [Pleurocapsa sp.]